LARIYTGNQQKVFRTIFGKQVSFPFLALLGKQMTCPFLESTLGLEKLARFAPREQLVEF
jgi:hypothetical protein